MKPII